MSMTINKVLVLGAGGMLGNAMMRILAENMEFEVVGTARGGQPPLLSGVGSNGRYLCNLDVENQDALATILDQERPDVIVNCIGLIKQRAESGDTLATLPINSLLPHRLARMGSLIDARVIHFSTDCVFSGAKGGYREDDFPDAYDLYGRSKFLGELHERHCFTVRTSIIGHELNSARSLIGWFLTQNGTVKGFSKAVFSGLPTIELARIVRDFILPRPDLHGLWHVSADPINKFELLKLVAEIYGKTIEIECDEEFVIDRSLNSNRFRNATSYQPAPWRQLVEMMHQFK